MTRPTEPTLDAAAVDPTDSAQAGAVTDQQWRRHWQRACECRAALEERAEAAARRQGWIP